MYRAIYLCNVKVDFVISVRKASFLNLTSLEILIVVTIIGLNKLLYREFGPILECCLGQGLLIFQFILCPFERCQRARLYCYCQDSLPFPLFASCQQSLNIVSCQFIVDRHWTRGLGYNIQVHRMSSRTK